MDSLIEESSGKPLLDRIASICSAASFFILRLEAVEDGFRLMFNCPLGFFSLVSEEPNFFDETCILLTCSAIRSASCSSASVGCPSLNFGCKMPIFLKSNPDVLVKDGVDFVTALELLDGLEDGVDFVSAVLPWL